MWRTPAFRADARRQLSAPQFKRFDKLYSDTFYLLAVPETVSDGIRFEVSSATSNDSYIVTFMPGRPARCTCMDCILHAAKLQARCKHACFALTCIMQLGLEVYATQALPSELVRQMRARCEAGLVRMGESNEASEGESFAPVKIPEKDDDCPICFCSLEGPLAGCPRCSNLVHVACMQRWLRQKDTCVFCRSDVWQHFRGGGHCSQTTTQAL
jgi:hypothetical protein